MPNRGVPSNEPHLPRTHLRALGAAVGLTFGVAVFFLTAVHLMLHLHGFQLDLLGQFFYGYDLSWRGAVVGLIWGGAVGFVSGWLLGFVHNFSIATWALLVRARHDPGQASDLLDNI